MLELLSKLEPFIPVDDSIEKVALNYTELGIKALDALHLASAEKVMVDYFCTCDDRFLKRAKKIKTKVPVVSPLELVTILEI